MITVESLPQRADVLRQAFGCFPSGVTAVCAVGEEGPVGMAVSSFTSVSLAPPLLSVCVQSSSSTWPKLRESPRLGVSVLAEHQAVSGRRLSMKTGDRFAGMAWSASPEGALFVSGAAASFDCAIHAEVPAGDHTMVLLAVLGLQAMPDVAPLVFHGSRFRRLETEESVMEAS
ncbi:flavin reductase [Nocardioides immobilis]|uniref:Flavin reductase n=1 Tax=Nocardioides immobilis TaxID=2049295 RepID=A0A417Y6X4_9ACTN|nr:flavin reductase family protein [Nocardioides immobilis]RHW28345.1 flavin reductase [Nocardioides immobilis]